MGARSLSGRRGSTHLTSRVPRCGRRDWAWALCPYGLPLLPAGPDALGMLIPIPLPAFTLAPGIEQLSRRQARMLDDCLTTLSGRVPGVMVMAAKSTPTHEVLELETTGGPLILMERYRRPQSRAA